MSGHLLIDFEQHLHIEQILYAEQSKANAFPELLRAWSTSCSLDEYP